MIALMLQDFETGTVATILNRGKLQQQFFAVQHGTIRIVKREALPVLPRQDVDEAAGS